MFKNPLVITISAFIFSEVNHETLNILKYVRPGGGFVPKFPVFGKVEVNGLNEEPLFTYLKVVCCRFEHMRLMDYIFSHIVYLSVTETLSFLICYRNPCHL